MSFLLACSVALLLAGCPGPREGDDPETCYDAVDNDGDGWLDCRDGGCREAAGCLGDTGGLDPQDRFCINEFMAANTRTPAGPGDDTGDGTFPDWIELYSYLSQPLDLGGYTVTDDLEVPRRHVLGDLVLPAGGYLLLYADQAPAEGPAHLSFALSVEGEAIGVFAPDGRAVDRLVFAPQAADRSAARIPDGNPVEDAWRITDRPTPGGPNTAR